MMDVLQPWKDHLRKLGDYWTDLEQDDFRIFPEKDKETMLRKKDLLKTRKAKIMKTDINGYILGVQKYRGEAHIRYRTHTAHLIKQKEDFYIEEEIKDKRAHFKNGILLFDEELESERPSKEQPFSVIESPAYLRSKSKGFYYDRLNAVKYADRWWNSENPEYIAFDVDCTNYVSQCLRAGGAQMSGRYNQHSGWWYAGKSWSLSWAVAHSLRWYLASDQNSLQAVVVDAPEKLQPGDVICYDFEGDNRFDHSTFVTGKDAYGMPLVNAHTTNSRHRYWSYEDSSAYTKGIQYKFFHIDAD